MYLPCNVFSAHAPVYAMLSDLQALLPCTFVGWQLLQT